MPTTVVLVALLSLTGCLVKPHALNKEEVKARAVKDVQTISSIEEPIAGPIDFYAAIARALKYNLDAKVKAMQVQLAHQQLNIVHYSLLPQVSANTVSMGAIIQRWCEAIAHYWTSSG